MRLLVAILTAHHHSREKFRRVVQDTWLKKCTYDHLFVFGNGDHDNAGPNELRLKCNDAYSHMALKCQGLFQYALDHDYEFVYRCCDDTFAFPERFHTAGLDAVDYAGNIIPQRACTSPFYGPWGDGYMHGGCGTWLSKTAMLRLVDAPWYSFTGSYETSNGIMTKDVERVEGCTAVPGYTDDVWMGEVLQGQLHWSDKKLPGTYDRQGIRMLDDPRFLCLRDNPTAQYNDSLLGVHCHTVYNMHRMDYLSRAHPVDDWV